MEPLLVKQFRLNSEFERNLNHFILFYSFLRKIHTFLTRNTVFALFTLQQSLRKVKFRTDHWQNLTPLLPLFLSVHPQG
jgi:hypothetical protein